MAAMRALCLLVCLLAGCKAAQRSLLAERPYTAQRPAQAGADGQKPAPLVIMLHGYSGSGVSQDEYFRLGPYLAERGVLYAYPDGRVDAKGARFWNATDACCDLFGAGGDDVAYITAIIDDMSARYRVDPRRIYVVGFSNGGFMAHRLACELSDRVAAIVSVAGVNWADPARCRPRHPVAVLQVHGDADETVPYQGGAFWFNRRALPSARDTAAGWAARNGCRRPPVTTRGPDLDLEPRLGGAETEVERFAGCPPAGEVELWTIRGGRHLPAFSADWPQRIYDFLTAHARR